MAHVTFIHGIANKPPRDALLEQWRVALLDNEGVDLDEMDVTSSMVYWADLLYARPLPEAVAQSRESLELDGRIDAGDADMTWLLDLKPDEAAFVAAVGAQVGMVKVAATTGEAADVIDENSPLEAIPLPEFVKRRLMRVFLRDVHHYLYDVTFSPRPHESYPVRSTIRTRTIEVLAEGAAKPGPHVLVTHSLGTVIAYDVLTGIAETPMIDALITLGSPLGLSEVQAKLAPAWTSYDGWPSQRLGVGSWTNIADRLDPVCGFDAAIAPDFRRCGVPQVVDVAVTNEGRWRHNIVKYFRQYAVRRALREALRGGEAR
ncbi:hypothetical protein AB0I34_36355 [Kribbella sp. NPDC050281]|uniref:hypothetical protein n=1 Tax=Kribbella sp. NPDC050281 TaxID=3155515 RepID=UPI0033F0523B